MVLAMDKRKLFRQIKYQPHPKQWLFHNSKARFRIPCCGRRYGKPVATTTPILTPSGWTTMAAIQVGDFVFGPDGIPTRVVGKSDVEYPVSYELVFDDATSVLAGEEHLWAVETYTMRKSRGNGRWNVTPHKVMTTAQLASRAGAVKYPDSIMLTQPLQMSPQKPAVDPYVWGVWLGDGTTGQAQLTAHDDDIPTYTREFEAAGYSLRKVPSKLYGWKIVGLTRSDCLRKVAGDEYRLGSIEQRLALLQGLMDTDGTLSNQQIQFDNKNLDLVELVAWLVNSLGGKGRFYQNQHNGETYHRFGFNIALPVFRLPRKLDKQMRLRQGPQTVRRYVKSASQIESVPMQCIQVAREDGLWLVGTGLVVTHNSTMAGREIEPQLFMPDRRGWVVGPTYDLAEKEFRVVWDDLIVGLQMGRDRRIKKSYNKRSGDMYIEMPWQTRLECRALAIDTPVPTPGGWTTMHALRVGDWVFDDKGQPTRVTAATDVMLNHTCYEVVFKNGERLVTDAGHQWLSYTAKSRHKGAAPKVVTTREMLATMRVGQWPLQTNHSVPLTQPVQYRERKYPVDPYVYGVWLGDGTRTKAQITNHPEDIGIVEEFEALGYCPRQLEGKCVPEQTATLTWAFDVPVGSYAQGSWLYDKGACLGYLEGSVDQRLAMLQGMMDTDGGVEKSDVSFSNCNLDLIIAVEQLVSSLGWTSYRTCAKANGRNRRQDNYRVHFQPTLPVFRLKRKLSAQATLRPRKSNYRYVKEIRAVESVPVKCIQVEAKSHLYLVGREHIVTHNSADHPENLVGESLDFVIMSEAAKHRKDTWERFILPSLADRRGTAMFPTTPEGFNWLYDLWLLGQNPDFPEFESWRFPSWDNPAVYPGGREDPEIKLIERTQLEAWFKQEIGADFSSFVGKIYEEWDDAVHIKRLRFNPAWPSYICFDWGFVNPLAAIEFQIAPDDTVYIWREHYKSFTMLEDHIRQLKAREQPEGYHLDLAFGDSADPDAAEYVSRHLVPCYAMPEAKLNWRMGIERVKSHLKLWETGNVLDEYGTPEQVPHLYVDWSCQNTIKEFNNYRSKEPIKGHNVPEMAQNVMGHALDAIRYALVHIYDLGVTYHLTDMDVLYGAQVDKAFERDAATGLYVPNQAIGTYGASSTSPDTTFNMGMSF